MVQEIPSGKLLFDYFLLLSAISISRMSLMEEMNHFISMVGHLTKFFQGSF